MADPHAGHPAGPAPGLLLFAVTLLIPLGGYLAAVAGAARRGRRWPWWRTAAWCAGVAVAATAVLGPAATAGHDLVAHMVAHLLLGMLAPLLLVVGRPVTVLVRALPVTAARRVSRVLASTPVRVLTHPVTAVVLDAGGLWLLYTTGLYAAMGTHDGLHLLVHVHLFFAGYLLTAAVVGGDPAPHRPGPAVRAAALVTFIAVHAILAKHLYAHPPTGVPTGQAENAAMLMYYGGDLIHLVLIVMVCGQWYTATRPRPGSLARPGAVTLLGHTP